MNAVQISKMLKNILSDFEGMGRKCHDADQEVIDCLMKFYYTTSEVDWQEIKWMFMSYLHSGVLDFSTAKMMAHIRVFNERGAIK